MINLNYNNEVLRNCTLLLGQIRKKIEGNIVEKNQFLKKRGNFVIYVNIIWRVFFFKDKN